MNPVSSGSRFRNDVFVPGKYGAMPIQRLVSLWFPDYMPETLSRERGFFILFRM
jgi:hypothetical protein